MLLYITTDGRARYLRQEGSTVTGFKSWASITCFLASSAVVILSLLVPATLQSLCSFSASIGDGCSLLQFSLSNSNPVWLNTTSKC